MNVLNLIAIALIATSLSFCNSETNQVIKNQKVEVSKDTSFNFENYKTNTLPNDWENTLTGKGEMCEWKIIDDNGNRVLAQTSAIDKSYRFNMAINKNLYCKDLTMEVRFKGMKGENDQGGGLVWRYIDENNYYIVRANPLEDNFTLYKVIDGNRKELKNANIKVNSQQWYSIKISMQGNKIQCYFNNKLMMETTDNTFPDAGKIGLWTKSDAQTYFDDLIINTLK